MKTISINPKVLLCTPYLRFPGDYFDVSDEAIYDFPKVSTPRQGSLGLRFIKQNVPEVEILEFPTWDEYVAKLKEGWDIVGFSFHNIELDEITKMAEEARCKGIPVLWAGNYGALDDRVPSLVDRIFVGPAEDSIAQVFGYRVPRGEVEHPPLMSKLLFCPGRIPLMTIGILYTHFGCPSKCTYCQSTVFNKRCYPVNLESIERVLRYYKKKGINYIIALDETFGALPDFSDQITELFARYQFNWWAQTRVEVALRKMHEWYERGLRMLAIGVESMNQETLNSLNKRQKIEEVIEFTQRSSEMKYLARMLYYQLGFPNMTAEETMEDAIRVSKLSYEIATVGVITPHPQTPLWDELDSKYGIFDRTNRHWNNATLVWNHPHITPAQMNGLREVVVRILNKPHGLFRLVGRAFRPKDNGSFWRYMVKDTVKSLFINDRKQFFFPKLGNGFTIPDS
ncbi:MAG: radical SAM protein [Candidatus Zixiibacteriota bacterium]